MDKIKYSVIINVSETDQVQVEVKQDPEDKRTIPLHELVGHFAVAQVQFITSYMARMQQEAIRKKLAEQTIIKP